MKCNKLARDDFREIGAGLAGIVSNSIGRDRKKFFKSASTLGQGSYSLARRIADPIVKGSKLDHLASGAITFVAENTLAALTLYAATRGLVGLEHLFGIDNVIDPHQFSDIAKTITYGIPMAVANFHGIKRLGWDGIISDTVESIKKNALPKALSFPKTVYNRLSKDARELGSYAKVGAVALAALLVLDSGELGPEKMNLNNLSEYLSGEKVVNIFRGIESQAERNIVQAKPLNGNSEPRRPSSRNRPAIYDDLGYTSLVEHDFSGTRLMNKDSTIGRIQRTLRWQPIYHAIENAYGIPQDTLAGMIMQESYGDPVQPNATNDGGLGVVHVQGTTSQLYGLRIFGSSNRNSDKAHGGKIRGMLDKCNYDPAQAQEHDDRAHLIKVLDVAARIVTEGREKHGSWDYGVEHYRAPAKVGRGTTWRYLRDVKKWRDAIRDPDLLERASQDFSRRNNGASFQEYIDNFHEMSNNWGLETYKHGMK